MQNFDIAKVHLCRLRKQGFSIYLDDFGTGYSSLSYIDQLPIIEIIAEGGELREQYELVVEAGIDYIQGYYFSKPISRKDALDLANI